MQNPAKFVNKIIPVILCGGSGSRLWPMSRESFPKQYLKCNPKTSFSFLQETHNRVSQIKDIQAPIIVCNFEHRFIVAEQMREIKVDTNAILLEPFGRNTAPAITISALKALEIDSDPILIILPADHSIIDLNDFIDAILEGIKFLDNGEIILFGIPPDRPEIGYGYIEGEDSINFHKKSIIKIKRFLEKPNRDNAKKFILNNKYAWNSGIFLLKAKTVIEEVKKYDSEIYDCCYQSFIKSQIDLDFIRLNSESLKNCPNKSFDVAIMENTKNGYVLPLNAGWDDIGSWESLWKISDKDKCGNSSNGKVFLEKTSNCFFQSENRLIVALGLENIIVVDTQDAVLITTKDLSQDVKNVVSKLAKYSYPEAKIHSQIFRPWGNYLSVASGNGWQVKRILVTPGAALSLQKHNHRTEHWIIVSGIALVEIESKKEILKQNQSTYIPLGFKHRLSNPGNEDLILIEVQSGTYLGEDDIYRYEDNYGRNTKFNNPL